MALISRVRLASLTSHEKSCFIFFFSGISVFFLDSITKVLVRTFLPLYASLNLFPFLSIIHTQNTGTLFGLLHQYNLNWFFIMASIAIIAGILYYANKSRGNQSIQIAWGLVCGGALGNLLDRILYGAVTDFIDVGFWPVFNIADAGITIGVIILIVSEFKTFAE